MIRAVMVWFWDWTVAGFLVLVALPLVLASAIIGALVCGAVFGFVMGWRTCLDTIRLYVQRETKS